MEIAKREETINGTELRIIGISRSGNHAIINWLLNQLDGTYCFLNCTEPKYNPFFTARPLNESGKVYRTNMLNFDLAKAQNGIWSPKDYLLYNHEDCFLGPLNKIQNRKSNEEWVGNSLLYRDILILRDPFNLFASRIKAGFIDGNHRTEGMNPISILTLQRIYKQHAREFLNEKNHLRNKIAVSFNSWATEKEYRLNLCAQLDIPFTDEGFHEVVEVAGGSSFDGIKFSGEAHKMNVNDRWEQFASNERYWSLFDLEMVELTKRIFGNIAPVQFAEQLKKAQ